MSDHFEFFVTESSHADVVVRTEAMENAVVICAVLGPERARDDLLPHLLAKKDDFDQVSLALAKSIGQFLPLIGGADFAQVLVPLFEMLCCKEETVVRYAATSSASIVLGKLGAHPRAKDYLGMFIRLAGAAEEGSEEFYPRVSACQLAAALYKSLTADEDKSLVREIYCKLLKDEMTIVRRAAVASFSKMFACVSPDIQAAEMIPLLKLVSADENAAAKVIAVESYVDIAYELHQGPNAALLATELVPLVKAATTDLSWRVRYAIAKSYGRIVLVVPPAVCKSELFPGAINLLMDNETEVRVLMCSNLMPFFFIVGGDSFLSEIIPIAQQLSDDSVTNVRKACAEMVVTLAAKCGNESSAKLVNELVIKIMGDENPLVRLRVIKMVSVIADELPSLCAQLTDSLRTHLRDKNWRVRKELIKAMPAVLKNMGIEFFTEKYMADFLGTFRDEVDEVRTAAAETLPQLIAASTATWVQDKVFPSVKLLAADDFINRIAFLNSLNALMECELPELFQNEVLTLMIASTNDEVPNVRLRAAQVLGLASMKIGVDGSRMQIRPILNELVAQDKDKDVKYFAAEALRSC